MTNDPEITIVKQYPDEYIEFRYKQFLVVAWPNFRNIYPPYEARKNENGKLDVWCFYLQEYIGINLPRFAIEIRIADNNGEESKRVFLADEVSTVIMSNPHKEMAIVKSRDWGLNDSSKNYYNKDVEECYEKFRPHFD